MQSVTILILAALLASVRELVAVSNASKTLRIKYFPHPPYVYKVNQTINGELEYILAYAKNGPCRDFNLNIEYDAPVRRYTDLLELMKDAAKMQSKDKIYALAPFIDDESFYHTYAKFFHKPLAISMSPGYTMITNKIIQNKIYRIVAIGLKESLTLIFALIIFTLIAAILMWLTERNRRAYKPNFSYRFLPGFWDGIWWASVSATTVGYGDKTPKTFLGKLVGLIWLFMSCTLLSSFTAILTRSLSEETSLNEKKIAYLNGTTAEDYINEKTGLPVAAQTYEEAIQMTLDIKVYGALLDTNYVTFHQEQLYKRGIVVETRFHKKEIAAQMLMMKNIVDENDTIFNCLQKELVNHAQIHKLKTKGNPYRTVAQKMAPSNSSFSLTYTSLYGITAGLVFIGIGIELVLILRQHCKKKKTRSIFDTPKKTTGNATRDKLLSELKASIKIIDKELANVKTIVAIMEGSEGREEIALQEFNRHVKRSTCSVLADFGVKGPIVENTI